MIEGRRTHRAVVPVMALTLMAGCATGAGEMRSPAPQKAPVRPNVVVITTDDQDLASMWVMRNVQRLLAEQGTTFSNSYASYSLCCPSRATFLTGQYAHNHGVVSNSKPDGGYEALPARTLPLWLSQSGYDTVHVGKYLNGYGRENDSIPLGWKDWYGLMGPSTYNMWGYTLNENGRLRQYGNKSGGHPATYQTDVLADKAVQYIKRPDTGQRPFFMWFTPLAPHVEAPWKKSQGERWSGPRPAPRHQRVHDNTPMWRSPSFNEKDMGDKPSYLRGPRFDRATTSEVTAEYRNRLESLLSVDEAVGRIYQAVKERGQLDRTLFVFTSDNGYMLGQHRFTGQKIHPYEESVRVPLIVRGPGFPAGRQVQTPVSNVDLPATILAVSGAQPERRPDGRPLQRFLGGRAQRDILLETGPRKKARWYTALRTDRYLYVEHSGGAKELYDMYVDPYQLNSRHADPALAPVRADLSKRLETLRRCTGSVCP